MLEHFKVRTNLLLIGILLGVLLIGFTISSPSFASALILIIPVVGILVWRLFRLVDKTNIEVATFLDNIKYNDYAVSFTEKKTLGTFRNLHGAFNLVNEKFRDIRLEKEAQFQYIKAIVENVDTGLICFDKQEKVILMNRALQQILHKSYFPTLSSVADYNQELHNALVDITAGEKKLIKLLIANQIVQLSIRKTDLILRNNVLSLFAIQNIHSELQEQEIDSWQKLIRILTHEIMNSITPVISLSSTIGEMMEQSADPDNPESQEIQKAIHAINKRSSGLLNFTESYRQLTKIPPPKFREVFIIERIEEILLLLQSELQNNQVTVERIFPPKDVIVHLDPDLIEQVFINLLLNAIESFPEGQQDKRITISVFRQAETILEIRIEDNGSGIAPDVLDQIWIPFYTTKEEGSGIGLSLSRQIILMHKGSIQVTSTVGEGTSFFIEL